MKSTGAKKAKAGRAGFRALTGKKPSAKVKIPHILFQITFYILERYQK